MIRVKTANAKGDNSIKIDKVSASSTSVNYTLKAGTDFDREAYDVYTAVYNETGTLAGVSKNAMAGSAPANASGLYQIKLMVWDKDTMHPSDIPTDEKSISAVAAADESAG